MNSRYWLRTLCISCMFSLVAAVSHSQMMPVSNPYNDTPKFKMRATLGPEKVLNVNSFPGTDIGAQLNACISAFSPTSPGLCTISIGTYALTTKVTKPQWVTIEGNNAVITVASLSTPAIVCVTTLGLSPAEIGTYSRRGIRNLSLF